MTPSARARALLARLRLVLTLAGFAWLLGYSPELGGRITLGLVVLLVLALDGTAGTRDGESKRRPPRAPKGGGSL